MIFRLILMILYFSILKVLGKAVGPVATVGLSHSRGPVFTGGRQVNEPRFKQSQLPRNCLRPPECNLTRVEQ